MKIVYAPASPVPSIAANSVHVMKMANALAALGHKVTLIAKKNSKGPAIKDPYAYYGVKPNFAFWTFYYLPRTWGAVLHALAVSFSSYLLRADLIYSRDLIIALIAVYTGHTVIFERHDSYDRKRPLEKRMFEKLIQHKNLKNLVVISKALADHLAKQHDIPREKIIIAPDGADPVAETHEISPFARQIGRPAVGYIGHLYPGRGIDVILAMAHALPDMDFHIVGGTPEDIAFWKDKTSNMTNLFLHGHVSPARTSAFMMNCDILLAPYQQKVEVAGGGGNTVQWMSPLKIFEYMSSGKPMICSDLPVLHEVLDNGVTALLCPPDDLAAWQMALQKLYKDSILAQDIGRKAKEKFLACYTWKKRAAFIINCS